VFYGIYEGEDSATPGRFTQGNKHYDPNDKYEDQIRALGQKFVKANIPNLLSPDQWMASTRPGSIVPYHKRPLMRAVIDKTTIKAGGSDAAVLTGAPKNVRCMVHGAGELLFDIMLPNGEFELSIPAPITYRVVLEKWPYQMFTVDIEAVT
jgi:hypothetical protein